jgi:hypothetical protein
VSANLRIYPSVGNAEANCFVRFYGGDDVSAKDLIEWMLDNDIRAVDDDCNDNLDPSELITMEAADRLVLWCWMTPSDAVLTRLRWAEIIPK